MRIGRIFMTLVILVFMQPGWILGQKKTVQRRVVDDAGRGIESALLKIDRKRNQDNIGKTDKDGNFFLVENCTSGERLRAVPIKSELYYYKEENCPDVPTRIIVTKIKYMENLTTNAMIFEKNEEFGTAAMIYTEIAFRATHFNPSLAKSTRHKAYLAWGKVFAVDNPTKFDPEQNMFVMTEDLEDAVKSFQQTNDIKATGKLDYQTMQRASRANIGEFIFTSHADR